MSGKQLTYTFIAGVVALFLVLLVVAGRGEQGGEDGAVGTATYTVENCVADECLAVPNFRYPARALPPQLEEALERSLQDTYQSIAFNSLVLTELGEGSPFLNIIRTDQHYLAAQLALFDKYNVTIPQNTWFDRIDTPESDLDRQLACARGFELKKETVRLYTTDLLPVVQDRPDLLKVFTAIANAADELQMPALDACYEAERAAPVSDTQASEGDE